jgi:recombination associated protein RdgC
MKLPFTKIAPYYFTKLQRWVPEALEILLQRHRYREIQKTQALATGFVDAIDDGVLVERVAPGVVFLRWKIVEKKVPKKVLLDKIRPRIEKLEEDLGGKLPRPEYMKIHDEEYTELLKVAFPTEKVIDIILTPTHALIGEPNWKKAEMILSTLRGVLGSLPVRPLACRKDMDDVLTDRMLGRQAEGCRFNLGDRFQAKNTDTKAVIRGTHVEVNCDEFQELVIQGMKVVEMELTFQPDDCESKIWFQLKKDGILKGIVWPPELSDKASADAGDEAEWQTLMRANLLMIYAGLEELLVELQDWCGGLIFEDDEDRPRPPTAHLAAALAQHALIHLARADSEETAKFAEAQAAVLDDLTGGARVLLRDIDALLEEADEEPEDEVDPDLDEDEDPLAGGELLEQLQDHSGKPSTDYNEDDLI